MRNILFINVIVFFTACNLCSCNDFLTCQPESSYNVEGAYKTQADFEQASAGMYSTLQDLYSGNTGFLYAINMRTDELNVLTPGNPNGYLGGMERFINDALNGSSESWFNHFFSIINQANRILEKIDNGIFSDKLQQQYIKGESLFFRGYAYWCLGYLYGGMTLYDKVYSVEDIRMIPRSTQDETFSFAEKDLKSAISLLPEQWSDDNRGRVSLYAAEALLVRMYMFCHQYSKAKPYAEDVINSGLFELASSYVDCVSEMNEYGKERLFEVQYVSGDKGEGQGFTTGCLPAEYQGDLQSFAGYNSYPIVSKDLLQAYEPGDKRKDVSVATNLVINGSIDDRNSYIIKFHHTNTKPTSQNDWGINLPIIRYTDVKLMYAEILNELDGVNETSISILNDVRKRAGLNPLHFDDAEEFKDALIRERRVEFAFEGLRWMDLLRWDKAEEVMNKFLSDKEQDGGNYRMKKNQRIFPIPNSVIITYNDNDIMWQNPEY